MRLGPVPAEWPEPARAFYEERAAIREVLGKMPRARAEAAALEDTRRWMQTTSEARAA